MLGLALGCLGAFGVTLENEAMRLLFAGEDEGFAVTGIVNKIAGDVRFIHRENKPWTDNWMNPKTGLWAVELAGTNSQGKISHYTVSNCDPARQRRVDRLADGLRFVFAGVKLREGEMDVYADVTLPKGAVESSWCLRVVNRSTRWGTYFTIYPALCGITLNGEADFIEPGGYLGWRRHAKYVGTGARARSKYFSQGAPMAAAYVKGDAGLLVAAHNGRGEMTKLFLQGEQNLAFFTPPVGAGVPGRTSEPGFPVSIGVFKGDWLTAAKLYRRWATNQVWCAKGPKIGREEASREMAEIALWSRPCTWGAARPSEAAAEIREVARRWPGLKVGCHWYGWHANPFNAGYPEYFPPKRGATNVFAVAKGLGYRIMPYMNALRWDATTVSYRLFAKDGACRLENGAAHTECFDPSYHPLALMCPSVPFWKEAVGLFLHRAVTELGANMIYLDELGLQHPQPCFAADHPHPIGGGTWYQDGYHDIVRNFRAAHPGIPITTEGLNEHWIDVVDGFLLAVPTADDVLPFYPAVYSDFASYFGTPLNVNADIDGFRAYQARQFVWGVQPGWMRGAPVFGEGKDRHGEWLYELGKARVRHRAYLCYGELVGELKARGETRTVRWPQYENPTKPGTYACEMPAVVGAWWRTADGRKTALVAVNHTEVPQTVCLTLPSGEEVTRTYAPLSVNLEEE